MDETQQVPNQNPATPVPPITTYPTPEPSTPNKTPLLAMVMVLLVGLTSYFGYQYFQLKQQLTVQQPTPTPVATVSNSPTSTSTPIPTSDPTVEWEIYTNSANGYSIKYPPSWILNKSYITLGDGLINATKINKAAANDIPNITINVYDSGSNYVKSITPGGEKTYIDNVPAIKNISNNQTYGIGYQLTHGTNTYFISIEFSDKQEASRQQEEFDQVISTFKFTK